MNNVKHAVLQKQLRHISFSCSIRNENRRVITQIAKQQNTLTGKQEPGVKENTSQMQIYQQLK